MKTEEVLTESRQNTFSESPKERRSAPSDFTIGGPLSAFSGIINLTPPVDSLKHRLIHHRPSISPVGPTLSGQLYPRAALYNQQFSDSAPDIPIAPAFAQIFQRRRRRENRPRRQRTTFTSEQTLKLELEYNRADYITRPRRFELAEILSLSESQIKIWFQNRRAKDKRIEKAHMDHQLRTMGYNNVQGLLPVPFPCSGMCGTCVVPPASLPVPGVSAMCSSTSKSLKLL